MKWATNNGAPPGNRFPKPLTQRGVGKRSFFYFCDLIAKQETNIIDNLNITTMKDFIEILTSEDKSFEGLPWWMYAIVMPAALVLMCMIGGTLS